MLTLRRRPAAAPAAHRPGRLGLGGSLAEVGSPNRRDDPPADQGRSGQDLPGQQGEHAPDLRDAEPTGHRWSAGSGLVTKATTGLLSLALLTGPAALALQVSAAPAAGPVVAAAGQDEARRDSRRGAAQELAGQLVLAWLTSTADKPRLAAYWSDPVDLPALASRVGALTVIDATATAPGVWSVTIGADVTAPTPKAPTVRRFFRVPVSVEGSTGDVAARALALPAQIAAPATAPARGLQYAISVPDTAPAGTTVSAYLSALLTGSGDITRYLSPGATVTAITPPPYAKVLVERIEASDEVEGLLTGTPENRATVHVRVTTTNYTAAPPAAKAANAPTTPVGTPGEVLQQGLTGQALLRLTARDGRWEVSGVDQAPQLSPLPPPTPEQPAAPTS